MEHLFYRKKYDEGNYDPDTLIRCLLSALKAEEETNKRLRNRVQSAESNAPWYVTGQPCPQESEWK